jgi:hypothetical protein
MFSRLERRRIVGLGIAAILGTWLVNTASAEGKFQKEEPRPILVGGKPKGDRCTSYGVSVGTVQVSGGKRLEVWGAPSLNSKLLDVLKVGHPVLICSDPVKRAWIGIIYHGNDPDADLEECRLSETSEKAPLAYRGPCKSGWVNRRFVQNSAG